MSFRWEKGKTTTGTLTVSLHFDHCVLRVGLPGTFSTTTWALLDTRVGLRLGGRSLRGSSSGHD
jgi:hypothetical protein